VLLWPARRSRASSTGKTRNTCILFGDGAGAVVLEATEEKCGLLSSVMVARANVGHLLAIEAGGSARPATLETSPPAST